MQNDAVDVKLGRIKTVPALKELKYFHMTETHDKNIQMKKKKLIKTFMMISNWKKHFGLHGLYKNILAL